MDLTKDIPLQPVNSLESFRLIIRQELERIKPLIAEEVLKRLKTEKK